MVRIAASMRARIESSAKDVSSRRPPPRPGRGCLRREDPRPVLASLNHPNIAQIHGIEKSDGTQALVLELVEGPTLADRIATGPIPLDEALPIAKQIAEALEAAHEAGVIHRDGRLYCQVSENSVDRPTRYCGRFQS